jgi:hypothetical protein
LHKRAFSIQLHPQQKNRTNENGKDNRYTGLAPIELIVVQSNEFALWGQQKPP